MWYFVRLLILSEDRLNSLYFRTKYKDQYDLFEGEETINKVVQLHPCLHANLRMHIYIYMLEYIHSPLITIFTSKSC